MWGRRRQADFDAEIQAHLELEASRLRDEGLSEKEARLAARRRFGNPTAARERFYEASRWQWLDQLNRDFRYAARTLAKSWGFTLGAGSVLALGIGATTAIFSVVNAVLLQPLAYPDADRIMSIETFWTHTGQASRNVSGPDFHDWRAQSTVFEGMAYHAGGETPIVVRGAAEHANAQIVTADFFRVFGQSPAAGRLLTAEDARSPLAVVSHRWAASHFRSPTAVLGQPVTVDGLRLEVVGVAAPGFRYPDETDVWMPAGLVPESLARTAHNYLAVGRLWPGVDLALAREQMRTIGNRIAKQHAENHIKTVALMPLRTRLTGDVQGTLWVLLGAVILVLLIACANIANLLFARAGTRTREVALRAALGAGRRHVVGQLLTESLMLAGGATFAGLVLAQLLMRSLTALAPADLPRLDEVRMDETVFLFALTLSMATTLIVGLVPALHASRLDLSDALKQGGAKGTVSSGSSGLRSALVVAEVALSAVLLVGAGLLLRAFNALHDVNLGFRMEQTLVAHPSHTVTDEEDGRRAGVFYRDLLERVRALPGVSAAAGVRFTPFRGLTTDSDYFIEGRPGGQLGENPFAEMQVITPGYFKTLGIPMRLGRDFDESDTLEAPAVAIINESLARASFPGESPLGHRIKTGYRKTTMEWMEIVGVAADARRHDPSRPPEPELFLAAAQHPTAGSLSLVVRTSRDEDSIAATLRTIVREIDPTVPVRFETMEQLFAQALAYPGFRASLVGAFAGLAVLVALVGLFSLLTCLVRQRTTELAVRQTVGARPVDLVRLITRQGVRWVALGLLLGGAGAVAAAGVLDSFLYEVSPWDWLTYLAVVVLLGLAAIVATLVPAIRAATIDPLIALRQE